MIQSTDEVAPVASESPPASPAPTDAPDAAPETPLTLVEMLEGMFLEQRRLNQSILELSAQLTREELDEFNRFLAPYGLRVKEVLPELPSPEPSQKGERGVY